MPPETIQSSQVKQLLLDILTNFQSVPSRIILELDGVSKPELVRVHWGHNSWTTLKIIPRTGQKDLLSLLSEMEDYSGQSQLSSGATVIAFPFGGKSGNSKT